MDGLVILILVSLIKTYFDIHTCCYDIFSFMFMHHARLGALRRQLADSFCSKVSRVSSSFSFNGAGGDFLASNIRTKYDCEVLSDSVVSVYNI